MVLGPTKQTTNKPKIEYEETWDVIVLIGSIAMGCTAIRFVWSKHVRLLNGLILEWWSENRTKNVCFRSKTNMSVFWVFRVVFWLRVFVFLNTTYSKLVVFGVFYERRT